MVPVAGDGISVSTLSVETSRSASSTVTESPTFLSQRVTVPSVTDSPRAGIDTTTLPVFAGATGDGATTGAATGAGASTTGAGATAAGAAGATGAAAGSAGTAPLAAIIASSAPTGTVESTATIIF